MGANCSCSCFGSAMGAEASKVASQSESLWPRFKRRIKQRSKNQSSKAGDFSNYGVEISPTYPNSAKSRPLVRIVSISRDGEFVPIILLPVGKSISRDRQPTKKEKSLGFDAVEMKVKSSDPKISVNSRKPEVCTQQKDEASVKRSDIRSWFRITKAFKCPKMLTLHSNGRKVSQNPIERSHSKDTKTPVIEHPKAQERQHKKEVADSIPGPIEHLSKSSGTSAAVDCKSKKLWKFINFHREVRSHGTRRQGIKSATLSQLPRRGMNSTAPNFQPKKINMSAERKGTTTGETTSEVEGYSMAINLSILIIIMACLVVFSNRLLAVMCTSIWWYLLPSLLRKYRLLACIDSGRLDVKPMSQRKYKENACIVSGACEYPKKDCRQGGFRRGVGMLKRSGACEYPKKDCRQGGFRRGIGMLQRPLQFVGNTLIPRFSMYKLIVANRVSVAVYTRHDLSCWSGMLGAGRPVVAIHP